MSATWALQPMAPNFAQADEGTGPRNAGWRRTQVMVVLLSWHLQAERAPWGLPRLPYTWQGTWEGRWA